MKSLRFLKAAAVSLACLGMVVTPTNLLADGPAPLPKAKTAKPQVIDVAMVKADTFVGQVVNAQGKPVENSIVSLRQGKNEIARTISGENGMFAVKNVHAGTYTVVAGQGGGVYRLWAENTAPPKALQKAVVIAEKGVTVRGQWGGLDAITLITVGGAVTAAILSGINLDKNNDIEDQLDQLSKSL